MARGSLACCVPISSVCTQGGAISIDMRVLQLVAQRFAERVDRELTGMGTSLCAAFCSLWLWAERHEPESRARRSQREDAL